MFLCLVTPCWLVTFAFFSTFSVKDLAIATPTSAAIANPEIAIAMLSPGRQSRAGDRKFRRCMCGLLQSCWTEPKTPGAVDSFRTAS